nr:DUF4158 domain-containing protein [Streptomyces sp. NRRL F-2664]
MKRYRAWIREYLCLVHDPARAREIAVAAMGEAAPVRASVVDLVNVALEELVRAGLELPGFSTLDRMAASIRTRVEGEICAGIAEGVGQARDRLAGLLVVPDGERRSPFDQSRSRVGGRHGRGSGSTASASTWSTASATPPDGWKA